MRVARLIAAWTQHGFVCLDSYCFPSCFPVFKVFLSLLFVEFSPTHVTAHYLSLLLHSSHMYLLPYSMNEPQLYGRSLPHLEHLRMRLPPEVMHDHKAKASFRFAYGFTADGTDKSSIFGHLDYLIWKIRTPTTDTCVRSYAYFAIPTT
jgi:hypothetical protein